LAKELKVDLSTLKGVVPTVEWQRMEAAANKGKQPDKSVTGKTAPVAPPPAAPEMKPVALHPAPASVPAPAPVAAATGQVVPLTTLQMQWCGIW